MKNENGMTAAEADKIENWIELSDLLQTIKEKEAELRREIAKDLLEGVQYKNGNRSYKQLIRVGHGLLTAKEGTNYRVDKIILETLWEKMTDLEKASIRWKPELNLPAYRKLDDQSLVHESVTSSPAMPTLAYTEK